MKVVFDARWILDKPSGIGVYAENLAVRMPLLAENLGWHFLFAGDAVRDRVMDRLPKTANITSETIPYGIHSPAGFMLKLPRLLKERRCDLFHTSNYMMPYRAFGKHGENIGCGACVSTIHDIIPIVVPGFAPRSIKGRFPFIFKRVIAESIARSAAVITVSNASRADIVSTFKLKGADAGKVRVVYNGVNSVFAPSATPAVDPARRVVMYVGRLDPYKNVVTLVRAFAEVRRKTREPLMLLIVGPGDERYPESADIARDLGIADDVAFVNSPSNEMLAEAYRSASVLVCPSSYEGFGLPIVEAMASGTPVVCCDGGAQREVAGDAAVVVAPGDQVALADAIETVLADGGLRRRLVERGLARAANFSWDKAAGQTLAIFESVLSGASAQQ